MPPKSPSYPSDPFTSGIVASAMVAAVPAVLVLTLGAAYLDWLLK
jgi:hypothetical protein